MRISQKVISSLHPNEVFVFGSNLSGIHGAGAAKIAMRWGAVWGAGVGLFGQTFAIPTKSKNIERTLTVEEIKPYVDEFVSVCNDYDHLRFLVTEIGCGLAGYEPKDIAPLFKEALEVPNIYLPERFIAELIRKPAA